MILTLDPFTHDLLTCSGITSGGTTSAFFRNVMQDESFRLLSVTGDVALSGKVMHSSTINA